MIKRESEAEKQARDIIEAIEKMFKEVIKPLWKEWDKQRIYPRW